jgi:hypothetical protein
VEIKNVTENRRDFVKKVLSLGIAAGVPNGLSLVWPHHRFFEKERTQNGLAQIPSFARVKISVPRVDTKGVSYYAIESPYQSGETSVRVFAQPNSLNPRNQRILFVLPVEPNEENHFGDGLTEILETMVDANHLIVVAPSFEFWPWYADHPTNPGRRQESYFTKAIVPLVDRLYPSKHQHRLLLGFSKSGWGALSLILRHPHRFEAACAWDAPLMKAEPDAWEMPDVFMTKENFRKYQVSRLLREKAKYFRNTKRLGIFGCSVFCDHMHETHKLMQRLDIQHDYVDGQKSGHSWGSGWMEEAVNSLIRMADALAKGSARR